MVNRRSLRVRCARDVKRRHELAADPAQPLLLLVERDAQQLALPWRGLHPSVQLSLQSLEVHRRTRSAFSILSTAECARTRASSRISLGSNRGSTGVRVPPHRRQRFGDSPRRARSITLHFRQPSGPDAILLARMAFIPRPLPLPGAWRRGLTGILGREALPPRARRGLRTARASGYCCSTWDTGRPCTGSRGSARPSWASRRCGRSRRGGRGSRGGGVSYPVECLFTDHFPLSSRVSGGGA